MVEPIGDISCLHCSFIHRTALGAGRRGHSGDHRDGRRQSERVALLRARHTKPSSDQPQEETHVRSPTRDRTPTSRDNASSCVSAAIQSERRG